MGIVHLESGAWTAVAMTEDGIPSRLYLGRIIIGDQAISAFAPFVLVDADGNETTIYCNYETFRCIDDESEEYSWEAVSFSTQQIESPLWTPEFKAKSDAKKRRREVGL
jgi:hypothetical protein